MRSDPPFPSPLASPFSLAPLPPLLSTPPLAPLPQLDLPASSPSRLWLGLGAHFCMSSRPPTLRLSLRFPLPWVCLFDASAAAPSRYLVASAAAPSRCCLFVSAAAPSRCLPVSSAALLSRCPLDSLAAVPSRCLLVVSAAAPCRCGCLFFRAWLVES